MLDVTSADVALTGSYQGRRRMTLTYPLLNRSRCILWLVTGHERWTCCHGCTRAIARFPPDGSVATSLWCWPTRR